MAENIKSLLAEMDKNDDRIIEILEKSPVNSLNELKSLSCANKELLDKANKRLRDVKNKGYEQ